MLLPRNTCVDPSCCPAEPHAKHGRFAICATIVCSILLHANIQWQTSLSNVQTMLHAVTASRLAKLTITMQIAYRSHMTCFLVIWNQVASLSIDTCDCLLIDGKDVHNLGPRGNTTTQDSMAHSIRGERMLNLRLSSESECFSQNGNGFVRREHTQGDNAMCSIPTTESENKQTLGSYERLPDHFEGIGENITCGDQLRWTHSWAP
jgi:hypothetical protein